MIANLLRRPKEAYENFISCLILTEQEHCADEIRKNEYEVLAEHGRLSGVPDHTQHDLQSFISSQPTDGLSIPVQESSAAITDHILMEDGDHSTGVIDSGVSGLYRFFTYPSQFSILLGFPLL